MDEPGHQAGLLDLVDDPVPVARRLDGDRGAGCAAGESRADRALAVLDGVKEWAPEVQRGKRVYSDERFVASVRKQLEKGEKDISERQLVALLKIGCRYREQVPEMEALVRETGHADLLEAPDVQPPRDTTIKKLELLSTVHWVASREAARDVQEILTKTYSWSPRKKQFSERQVGLAADVLSRKGWTSGASALPPA